MTHNLGLLVENFQKWGRIYRVEADITATTLPSGWKLVFLFSQDPGCCQVGQKIPAVYIKSKSGSGGKGVIGVFSAISGQGNVGIESPLIDVGTKYNLVVQQFEEEDAVMYTIELNGVTIHSVENTEAKDFLNVKVITGDASEYGILENFKYSGAKGKYQIFFRQL